MRTENQLADILTKGVSSKIFNSTLDKLGIWDIYALAWEGVLEDIYA